MAIKLKVQSTEVKLKIAGSDAATLKASEGIPIYPDPYTGAYTVTPSAEEQTLSTNGLMMTDDVTVAAVLLEEKSVSPSTEEQTVTPDDGYYGLSDVVVAPMTNATPKTIQESTRPNTPTVDANGLVTATTTTITGTMKPVLSAGYADADFSVPYTNTGGSSTLQLDTQGATTITPSTSEQTVVTAGKYMTGDAKVSAMPNATWRGGSRYEPVLSLSVSDSGLITGSVNTSSSVQPLSASGYAEKTHNYPITIVASNTQQLSTVNGSTVTPTESEQTAVAANKYTLGAVKVGAISSTYVGSGIPVDPTPTASGKTVTIPTGYYSSQTTKDVAAGSAGTPTASKGTVSNHSISVTPSVTNTAGYISGSTKTGTAVTVSASELVSGSETKTANGTYDVTDLAELVVNVSGGGGSSNWTLIASGTLTVNTTSTSAGSAGTISCGSAAWTETDIIWVRIRGQKGKTAGYFYGSDAIFANYRAKNGSTSADSVPAIQYYRVGTDGLYVSATGSYGVYAYSLASNGTLTVRRRYNATNTLTINDKFDVEVYKLTLPTGKSLFT